MTANKKIIFIGGTSRSGSTLLDVFLANDPKAMSLGEIYALFHPTRVHHFEEIEKLRDNNKWNKILKGGKRNLFDNLIKEFPDMNTFVDSSKDPFWINYHEKRLKEKFQIYNVLIYKAPEELAQSFKKRGQEKNWFTHYINYHRKYFSLIKDCITVSYFDFINNEKTKKDLCNYLHIHYSEEKSQYWKGSHSTFFGSNSIKSEQGYIASKQITSNNRNSIEYQAPELGVINKVALLREKNKIINVIEISLNSRSLSENHQQKYSGKLELKVNPIIMLLLKVKRQIFYKYKYHFPSDYFKKQSS